MEPVKPRRVVGRYALFDEIASGGMATVHYGRLLGPVGFSRTVAIKRLHPEYARDPEFVSMFVDEARLAARIRHPNVVPTLDVIAEEGELFLVMDYVLGAPLSAIMFTAKQKNIIMPPRIGTAILSGCLQGLHAAHEATDESGVSLGIVHRDVSPQNILVGADGVPRVLDFGIAKASGRTYSTRDGSVKGKVAYMAPEQMESGVVTRQADLYAATVVLWEAGRGRGGGGGRRGRAPPRLRATPKRSCGCVRLRASCRCRAACTPISRLMTRSWLAAWRAIRRSATTPPGKWRWISSVAPERRRRRSCRPGSRA